jgi:tRNA threonylcarbamoyladenosine biosynthesis protein TsaE
MPQAANPMTIDLPDPDATTAFGRRLGAALFPGAVVALVGPLGAGKTHLARAIAEGLGMRDGRAVSSPTFGLIHEYSARLPVYHFDVYRLRTPAEFLDLGAHEYFDAGGVSLIEWADKIQSFLPAEYLCIDIEVTGESTRRAKLTALGEKYHLLVASTKPQVAQS